eukprot:4797262-Karenia_brevis.AAC.1
MTAPICEKPIVLSNIFAVACETQFRKVTARIFEKPMMLSNIFPGRVWGQSDYDDDDDDDEDE